MTDVVMKEETFEYNPEEEKDDDNNDEEPEVKDDNDEIEVLDLKPSLAFQTFGGKVFDPKHLMTKNWSSTVYGGESISSKKIDNNKELEKKFESPLEKYQRLAHEILSFEQELKKLSQTTSNETSSPTKQIGEELNNNLKTLWSNVNEFKNNPKLSSLFSSSENSQLLTIDSQTLIKRLVQYSEQNESKTSDNDNNNGATLTLYHSLNQNLKSQRLSEVQERVSKLEKIIGPTNNDNNNNNNNNDTGNNNLNIRNMTGHIEYLTKRMDLLSDTQKLEQLKRRAQTLKQALNDLKFDSQITMEDQITKSKEQKINKMFEMMERWDQGCQALPNIIERLKALKTLHENSVDLVSKVDNLSKQQSMISNSLKENQSILQQVNKSLGENANTMMKNIQSIEERMNKLQQKFG